MFFFIISILQNLTKNIRFFVFGNILLLLNIEYLSDPSLPVDFTAAPGAQLTSSQAPSYASPKLRLTDLLTGVKCRATNVAKNHKETSLHPVDHLETDK